MESRFDRIVILGTGQLFLECLSYVSHLGMAYEGYEMSGKESKLTGIQAKKRGIRYEVKEKNMIFQNLASQRQRILLISAINPVIIPQEILDQKNILALNCHQALLPKHKGRNAESWAIYEGDELSGITWHKMTGKVDEGDILCQKMIPVTEDCTAYGLFRQQIQAAYEAFAEFMPDVLAGRESYVPQNREEEADFHYSWEVPAQGMLDPQWSGEQISRFLRAMDYGILKVMPYPGILLNDEEYRIKKYEIYRLPEAQENFIDAGPEKITMILQDYKIILSRLELVKNNGK